MQKQHTHITAAPCPEEILRLRDDLEGIIMPHIEDTTHVISMMVFQFYLSKKEGSSILLHQRKKATAEEQNFAVILVLFQNPFWIAPRFTHPASSHQFAIEVDSQ